MPERSTLVHQASLGGQHRVGPAAGQDPAAVAGGPAAGAAGHVKTEMPANPLAPKGRYRRHPKMLPDGARKSMIDTVNSARDRLIMSWLADGGLRIGELCGLCCRCGRDQQWPHRTVVSGSPRAHHVDGDLEQPDRGPERTGDQVQLIPNDQIRPAREAGRTAAAGRSSLAGRTCPPSR